MKSGLGLVPKRRGRPAFHYEVSWQLNLERKYLVVEKAVSLKTRHDWELYRHLAVRLGLVLCQKDSFRYAFAFGKATGQSKTALNRAISPPM